MIDIEIHPALTESLPTAYKGHQKEVSYGYSLRCRETHPAL